MKSISPSYERGFLAGKMKLAKDDNPYPKKSSSVVYTLTDYDSWEAGRCDGLKCCPYCNETGIINNRELIDKLEKKIDSMQKVIDAMYNGDISKFCDGVNKALDLEKEKP